jgi:hypothetical protein
MSYESVEEFLARGGKIEKLDPCGEIKDKPIGSISKQKPQIMSLAEGELMFGKKSKRVKKEKEPDYSDINFDLIPEHLRKILNPVPQQDKDKGDNINETN